MILRSGRGEHITGLLGECSELTVAVMCARLCCVTNGRKFSGAENPKGFISYLQVRARGHCSYHSYSGTAGDGGAPSGEAITSTQGFPGRRAHAELHNGISCGPGARHQSGQDQHRLQGPMNTPSVGIAWVLGSGEERILSEAAGQGGEEIRWSGEG